MPERIINSFKKFSEKNAFHIKGSYYKYRDLEHITSGITDLLNDKINYESNIGVIASDDIYTYSALLATLLSGRAYVPINPQHPAERNRAIIKQAGVKSVLTSLTPEEATIICGVESEIFNTQSLSPSYYNEPLTNTSEYDEETTAYILFTSGSTGIPKGVPISRKNLFAFCDAFFENAYDISCDDRFLQMFDLTFDLSVMSYLIPLMTGSCVYTTGHSGIKYTEVYEILEEHEITFALMVPSIITALKPYFDDIRLEKLKYSLFCGEALHYETLTLWQKCVPNALVQNVYGPTEATIFCMSYNCSKDGIKAPNGIVSIGKPMKDVNAIIIDETNKVVKPGEKGELCLNGPQLTKEYYNLPEITAKAFVVIEEEGEKETYYKTGDICYTDEDGDFMFCGRTDQQVKVQGYRIELSEVEHFARKLSGGLDCVAVTRVNKQGHSEIVLFIKEGEKDKNSLLTSMRNNVPQYMLPSEIRLIKDFPKNSNGKTDRKELAAMASIT